MIAVSMIADQPPLGKAGEGLDVGRDPGDEHPASAFGVVGEAQMVDVLEDTDRRFISTVSAMSTSRIRARGSQRPNRTTASAAG